MTFFLVLFLLCLYGIFSTTIYWRNNSDPSYIRWRNWLIIECFFLSQILYIYMLYPGLYVLWSLMILGIGMGVSIYQMISLIPAVHQNKQCPILKAYLISHCILLFLCLILLVFLFVNLFKQRQ